VPGVLALAVFVASVLLSAALLALTGVGADASLPWTAGAVLSSMLCALMSALVVSRTPHRGVVMKALLPWSALFGVITLLIATLVRIAVSSAPPYLPAAVAFPLAMVVLAITSMLWFLPLRAVFELGAELRDPKTRTDAIRRIHTMTANVSAGTGYIDRRNARNVVIASSSVLIEALCFRDALEVLGLLKDDGLPNTSRLAALSTRAVSHLYLGEHADSARALDAAISMATLPAQRANLLTLRALTLAITGHADEASRTLSAIAPPTDVRFRRGYLLARANVEAGLGRDDDSLSTLREIARGYPKDGLVRVRMLGGPASKMAVKLPES
jgi:hypothetical protein